jgi:serine phosphatase RsbU (regulator of sigma subunit)
LQTRRRVAVSAPPNAAPTRIPSATGDSKPSPRADAALIRCGRAAVLIVLLVAALDWVGWASGVEELTRIVPSWPRMTAWTALWLATLGVSIVAKSYGSRTGLVWVARGLAAAVGASAVVVLAQYVTGQNFGIDDLWFTEALHQVQGGSWPGRPSPQTASATLVLSVALVLPLSARTGVRTVRTTCMVAALVIPSIAILSYLFGAIGLVSATKSTGIALTTAICLLLLVAAALLLRPDGVPRAWLLSGTNRRLLIRIGAIVASYPILVGLSWRVLLAFGAGEREGLIVAMTVGTLIVGTAALHFAQRIVDLSARVQKQAEQLTKELETAAAYMVSIMPYDLAGVVDVSSRYLPSRELGGDCFDYHWVDDDHLVVYLIDVSGHGIEPALLAVSAHNMLRSGSIPFETALEPEAVLAELNGMFQMEQQNNHYFTMWYGVYEASTRILRYASAGSPPALAFTAPVEKVVTVAELSTLAAPVGLFEETEFISRWFAVPPGCRILVYSDGASELELADGHHLTPDAFKDLTTELARSQEWSIDELIAQLRATATTGTFADDCSTILMVFD